MARYTDDEDGLVKDPEINLGVFVNHEEPDDDDEEEEWAIDPSEFDDVDYDPFRDPSAILDDDQFIPDGDLTIDDEE